MHEPLQMMEHRHRCRRPFPLELRWDSRHHPLPKRWVIAEGQRFRTPVHNPHHPRTAPLDFCAQMRELCEDVTRRCDVFRHIRIPSVLVSFTPSRNRSHYGLQARVTPLRFTNGRLTRRHGAVEYQVQRFVVDGAEMLYVLTFCLPRFLDQSFEEKLVTIFHELYHMSPEFDGDLRRLPGRYAIHSHSKSHYDRAMSRLVAAYLVDHPKPDLLSFLRCNYRELWERNNGITGVVVPRPKLLPVGWLREQAAQGR